MNIKTDLLIIGAGPFGLSMAAYAKHHNLDFLIVGKTMEFWKNNMPDGMYLRSGIDWHIDPVEEHTFYNFLESQNGKPADTNPISLNLYLQYTEWFRRGKGIDPINSYVTKLDNSKENNYPFKAYMDNGSVIESKATVIAIGFGYFKYIPEELSSDIPDDKFSHTCDLVNFSNLKSKSCLIIGGRQSAFEWASLISKAEANKIYVAHRHKTPEFKQSDWLWVTPIVEEMADNSEYYVKLSKEEKEVINNRFWKEGRLKLEPWLAGIKYDKKINIYPESKIASISINDRGLIQVLLDRGDRFEVDHIIFATGYKVDISRVPFLSSGNVLENIEKNNGYPKLKTGMQSSVPGLYFTSFPATQDYGAFFGFTVSCRASAKIIGYAIRALISAD